MPRYKFMLEYDGRPFVGWQRQDNGPTVQAVVEEAAFRLSGEEVTVQGAGRTDSGVHALGQVAHVDLGKDFPPDTVRDALNHHLRHHPVSILTVDYAAADFHARFSATGRSYLFRILNRRPPPAIEEGRVWWVPVPLDSDAMHDAAQSLLGKHDFTTFRSTDCQANSPVRTLDRLDVRKAAEEIHLIVEARSFLHHQVRNFAGTLRLVGEGKWSRRDVEQALSARDRRAAGPTAPPHGLYLTKVDYDNDA